jgi:hypothetical protein
LPSGATFIGRTFSWTPNYDQAGIYYVTFNVSDGSAQDYETIKITVNNVNRAPVIDSFLPANTTLKTRESYSLQFNQISHDPDSEALNYSWRFDGVEKSTATSWLYTASLADVGSSNFTVHNVTVVVRDPYGAAAQQSWSIEVKLRGDVKIDCIVNIFDLATVGKAYGSSPGGSNWNKNADISPAPKSDGTSEGDNAINVFDLATVGANYGNHCG